MQKVCVHLRIFYQLAIRQKDFKIIPNLSHTFYLSITIYFSNLSIHSESKFKSFPNFVRFFPNDFLSIYMYVKVSSYRATNTAQHHHTGSEHNIISTGKLKYIFPWKILKILSDFSFIRNLLTFYNFVRTLDD